MKPIRIYTEKKYFPKKNGGGSFFRWIDMEVKGTHIEIRRCHRSYESNNKKRLPTSGSGCVETYTHKESKALVRLLQRGIKIIKLKNQDK